MNKLTIKQEKFAQGLFVGKSQREAYKEAYNCTKMNDNAIDVEASRLANNPMVSLRIKELTDELKAKNIVSVEWVLKRLVEVNEKCMQAEPLYDKEGNVVEYTFQAAGANKSLELIGKHLGMFTDKVEAINHNVNEDISNLSDIDRQKRIDELVKKRNNA